ncbi:MAG: imidazoleglycerol-phosphate dehydratase HisB [Deltaproteobacteria bacterium]|nr:imidazoleglycerol-phosphate dehydratase HisB [Deltaproteobacteria bacterium]
MQRKADISRKTNETDIEVAVNLDGTGVANIRTGLPFMDHMLTLMAAHGAMDLTIRAQGDIEVDYHHTLEDTGICLGQALRRALGDCAGIHRYASLALPMDEALVSVALDISNRPFLVLNLPPAQSASLNFDTQVIKEFMRALVLQAGLTLHVNLVHGENTHHIYEACFKGLGRALRQAVALDERCPGIPSTKGTL